MSQPTIVVAHPGAAPSIYELGSAVHRLGYRLRFETSFFYTGQGPLAALVRAMPAGLQAKLTRELGRRRFDAIPPECVHQHALSELAYVATARKFPHRPDLAAKVMQWRNRRFDESVAAWVRQNKPAAVIGHDTSALAMLRAAKSVGSVAILHQMIGHMAIGDAIVSEEARLQPDWADSLHAGAPQWLIDQCRAEAVEADHVIASSPYVRDTLIDVGAAPERVHIVPYGVRVDRFFPADRPRDDGKLRLIYCGQISQRKGLSYLLEAVKRLGDSRIELVLLGGMVGAGRGLAPYDGLYRHLRNVPHGEVPAILRDADLFVYPSLHEGSALAIFEAMASGLPVICTPNSGSMVRHGQDGLIVPIRDVTSLANAIGELRDDADRRRQMGISARGRALEFTWDAYRQRLGDLLTQVLP